LFVRQLQIPRAFVRTIARGQVIDHWRCEKIERAYLETIALLPESKPRVSKRGH
jgi:DNA-directed RNA polymerase specialized sigma24 family protein